MIRAIVVIIGAKRAEAPIARDGTRVAPAAGAWKEAMMKFKKASLMMSLVLLGAAATSVGCGAADLQEEAGGSSEEEVDVTEEALGESGCGTMTCTAANSCAPVEIAACGSLAVYKSSPLPYGSGPCPAQFVVQDKTPPTNGGRIVPMWRWRGAPLTAANCASAVVEAALYAQTGTTSAPVLVGTEKFKGVWSGSVCALTSPDAKPAVNAAPGLKEVRATASARLGGIQQRVDAGVWRVCS